MPVTLKETQLIAELANALYEFLPANPHPYGNQAMCFKGCAQMVGIENYWPGGSKRPGITGLLRNTLEYNRGKFCPLILFIVKYSVEYRNGKNNPLKREEVLAVNRIVAEIGYKVPELWNTEFLRGLASDAPKEPIKVTLSVEVQIGKLKDNFISISKLEPQARGYAFEQFLNSLFEISGLKPRSAFRIVGEQIDGSFEVDGNTYLVEAKWQSKPTSENDLLIFSGKVAGKATWSRGLFVSFAGYSKDGLEAFARGKQTNLIGMDSQDLYFILDDKLTLVEALKRKARRAVETNSFFVSVFELANQ